MRKTAFFPPVSGISDSIRAPRDQGGHVFRRRELRNAMTKIEYVAGSIPEGLERLLNFAADDFGRGQQYRGIEIALERGTGTDPPASISKVDAPVQTDAIASGRGYPLKPRRPPLGEDDDRDCAAPELSLSWDSTLWITRAKNSLYDSAKDSRRHVSKIITTFTPASICAFSNALWPGIGLGAWVQEVWDAGKA